ncbi:MAG TPA: GspH/FimT family pseudopilin [Gemmatimonadaceae bacterium]|nr:GspH/FimT family pseudopilin [Gemmatimonadaceae bacterium]
MRQHRGFTLVEILVVITIVGILLSVVVPRYGSVAAAMRVHSAKQEMASMLTQARATAIQTDRTVQVIRSNNLVTLVSVNGAIRTTISQQDLGTQFGITLTSTKDTVGYDSRGMVAGNNVTLKFVVTNGVTRDSVCLMALGTISRTGCSL